MADSIQIVDFEPMYQQSLSKPINRGLGERFGYIDESLNLDLQGIELHFKDGNFLLALAHNELVGTGAILPEGSGVGRIVRMATDSKLRREGVGTRVIQALEQREKRGLHTVILNTKLE